MSTNTVTSLTYSEGIKYIKQNNFIASINMLEDDEHAYYENFNGEFLIYFKYLQVFIVYQSFNSYKIVTSDLLSKEELAIIDFKDFDLKIKERLTHLNQIFNINLSENDSLEQLKEFDNFIYNYGAANINFKQLFMEFYTYYYIIIKNELSQAYYEIVEENKYIEFYIFLFPEKKTEIFRNFIDMIEDPDRPINFFYIADLAINPLIIKTGQNHN